MITGRRSKKTDLEQTHTGLGFHPEREGSGETARYVRDSKKEQHRIPEGADQNKYEAHQRIQDIKKEADQPSRVSELLTVRNNVQAFRTIRRMIGDKKNLT